MAALASVTKKEITGVRGMEVVKGTVTTTGDTYTSRFGTVTHVVISDETTTGGASCTFTGSTITITATGSDVVDMIIFGR